MVKSQFLKTLKGIITLSLLVLLISESNAQNEVAIGSTTTKSNAILWLNGNGSQGLILPVVTNKTAVSAEKGMIVYDNSDNKVWYRNDNTWVEVGGGPSGGDNGNLGLQIQGNQLQLLDGTKVQSSVNIAGGTATSGAFMIWTGTSWQYTTLSDVSGATGQVTGIKGKPVPNLPTTTQALVYDGTAWQFKDLAAGSDTQTLTFASPNLSISNGNTVNLSALDKDQQTLTLSGNSLSISGGNSVVLPASTGVTSITAGTGLTGGTITTIGTINVDVGTTANKIVQLDGTGKLPAVDGSQLTNLPGPGNSGVTPGVYGSATAVPQITVDALGRITAITTFPPLVADGSITGGTAGTGVKIAANTITDANILSLNASKITSGTLPTAQVPNLDASKITSGTFNTAQIPNLDASKITTGTFNTAQIPNLDASKITSGVIPTTQGGTGLSLSAGSIGNGQLLIGANPGFVKANLTAGSGIDITNGAGSITISSTVTGTVTNVSGTAPVSVASGATTPVISISQANASTNGYLSSADWNTFNNKGNGTVTSVTGTAPITVATGTSTPVISMTQANTTTSGFLSSADWNTFNSKQGALTLTTTGTSGAATLTGNTLNIPQYAYTAGTGLTLTGNTFSVNPSQNISTLSNLTSNGLIKTSGGTGALSIATPGTDYLITETDPAVKAINGIVKSNGTTLSAAAAGTDYVAPNAAITGATATKITYDAKGLVTSGTSLVAGDIPNIAQSQVTNLVADLAGKQTQLNGTGLVRAAGTTITYDNATYLTSETDPAVKSINGIVKSNGTTLSAAAAGTDYVAPNAAITGATATKITYDSKGLVTAGTSLVATDIPDLDASKITSGTLGIANGGTGAATAAAALTNLGALGTATTAGGDLSGTFSNLQLVSGTVVDADISGTAAILGTKITPSFGGQNISTTGSLTTGTSTTFGTAALTWPAANASGVLTNDGTGALTWAASSSGWGLTGNTGTNPSTNFLGTADANDFVIRTNNTERLRVKATGQIWTQTNPFPQTVTTSTALPLLELYKGAAEATTARIMGLPTQSQILNLLGQDPSTGAIKGWSFIRAANESLILTNNSATGINATINSNHAMIIDGTTQNVWIGSASGSPDATAKLTVDGQIKINGGTPGAGKVLTSDANGLATWQTSSGLTNPMTTTGDIIYGGASGTPTRLAAGTAGFVLTSNGPATAPTWTAPSSVTGWATNGNSITSGNFIGTTNNLPLVFRVNNTISGYISVDPGGTGNTSFGYGTLSVVTSGTNNTAVGNNALVANTTGIENTAVGLNALQANTAKSQNTAIGKSALFSLSGTGTGANTAIGFHTLYQTTTGNNNTALGYLAGTTGGSVVGNASGNSNTYIGANSGPSANNFSNASAIGAGAIVAASNTMVFGNTSVVSWGFGVQPASCCDAIRVGTGPTNGNGATLTFGGTWTSTSDSTKKFNIQPLNYGLDEIMKLNPVNYQWKGTGQQDIGFIAQEVKKLLPEIVYGEDGSMTMSYGHITAVLTKAMQEQQKQIENLKAQLQERDNKVNSLESSVSAMKNELEEIKRVLGMEAKATTREKKGNK